MHQPPLGAKLVWLFCSLSEYKFSSAPLVFALGNPPYLSGALSPCSPLSCSLTTNVLPSLAEAEVAQHLCNWAGKYV